MENAQDTTALIIEHTIKKGDERRYEKWLGEILKATKKSSGYLGREVFPPDAAGKPYIIIVRYRTSEDLQKWLDSAEREMFINEMRDALSGGDKTFIKAGIDVWFSPANAAKTPPAYKQFLVTAIAIYPLSLIVPQLLAPLFEAAPALENPLLGGLLITVILVGLMTYLIMPLLTGWLRDWLYETANRDEKMEKT